MQPSVLIAMSGGVDSSTAASLLVKMGYKVVGVTMKLWDFPDGTAVPQRGCCSFRDTMDAADTAAKIGIPHYTVNLKDEFYEDVIRDFISEYKAGRTPNPCIRCNTFLKWGALWKKKEELGLDYIATGHYARVLNYQGDIGLYRSLYLRKDQSYALWGIPYAKLKSTIFPLGELTKDTVRKNAKLLGLRIADKPDSQEICFIPDKNYGSFLHRHGVKIDNGEIVDTDGNKIGTHPGYIHYTIGQRKGLGGGAAEPLYVSRIDPAKNRIVAGTRDTIRFKSITVQNINWLVEEPLVSPFSAEIKIRYNDPGRPGEAAPQNDGTLRIDFPDGVDAPTPGQSAVVYRDGRVICGGIIISCCR